MAKLNELSWGERFAVIAKLNPTDEQIQAALGIDADELAMARELLSKGTFAIDQTINPDLYADAFGTVAVAKTEEVEVTTKKVTTAKRVRNVAPPATATKPVKVAKKRGRKGTKIALAFAAIDTTPVAAEVFASQHGVSLNVLRQAKRFDQTGIAGRVHVKKVNNVLSVYREAVTK